MNDSSDKNKAVDEAKRIAYRHALLAKLDLILWWAHFTRLQEKQMREIEEAEYRECSYCCWPTYEKKSTRWIHPECDAARSLRRNKPMTVWRDFFKNQISPEEFAMRAHKRDRRGLHPGTVPFDIFLRFKGGFKLGRDAITVAEELSTRLCAYYGFDETDVIKTILWPKLASVLDDVW
jgi:hypothetical protein